MVAHNPFLIGVVIDEDTSIDILPDNVLEVVGRRTVTILDGTDFSYLRMSATSKEHRKPLCIYEVKMHILLAGCTFDILSRKPTHRPEAGETSPS